jgi:hypothetical protein
MSYGTTNTYPATANTGGGGGGNYGSGGSLGGSGIVILKFANTVTPASVVSSAFSVNTGGYKYYVWTGSGSITF